MARIPVATYRLQLGEHLDLDGAAALLPYLERLGVDTVYLSPPFASVGGAGYHVTDPNRIDPALGGEAAFDRLAEAAAGRGMGLLIDIVPNHMKASEENPWWADVLREGRGSPHARFFDIDWDAGGGKLIVPTLPEPGPPVEGAHTVRMWWEDAAGKLNYRRFFDVSDLVCMRQEDPEIFEATHRLILRLVGEGKVTGLRVDHVDGLRDPQGYLDRLAEATGGVYTVVEKILAPGEELPASWPVHGTTGYEAGDAITGVLTDPEGAEACDRIFARAVDPEDASARPFSNARAKREVLAWLFPGEVERLAGRLHRVAGAPGVTRSQLAAGLVEMIAALDVYRTYVREEVRAEDLGRLERALAAVRPSSVREALERALLGPGDEARAWVEDLQVLTGPAMAKGHEDTALYRHTALVSRNEVGGDPGVAPPEPAAFHERFEARQERWPGALTATSTHDSQRSEDVRARIAVLSELPEEWEMRLSAWREAHPRSPVATPDRTWHGTAAEELLLYQTLLGTWPAEGDPGPGYLERIQRYLVKAAREAKENTSWLDPHEAHERELRDHAARLIGDPGFVASFGPFARRIAFHGMLSSLSQAVLRITLPGVPDTYQGAEAWHLRLVDPDNRGPVDFDGLATALEDLDTEPRPLEELRETWPDGRLKLWLTSRASRLRRDHEDLFREGTYEPLGISGSHTASALAFARRHEDRAVAVVVPRLTTRISEGWPIGEVWADTEVALPAGDWTDALTGALAGPALRRTLGELPVALLVSS